MTGGKKVIGCIAVRAMSTRLPRKAFADIAGKPMLLRLIERLRTAETLDEIVICTADHPDDVCLVEAGATWGVPVVAGSPLDVLSRFILAADKHEADVAVRITGDNVFTDAPILDAMVRHHVATGADYTRTHGLPNGVTAEIISTEALKRVHALMPDPNQSEYLTLYIFDPEHFHCEVMEADEALRRPNYALGIDTPEELALVQRLYADLPEGPGGPRLEDVIAALDANPDYKGVPDDIPVKLPGGEKTTYGTLKADYAQRAERARARNAAPRA